MNNDQFRRLVLDKPSGPSSTPSTRDVSATPTLGSRQRASIPMTPRSLSTIDFRSQLAAQQSQPLKKFKSSAAPKGSKLAAGYTDRAAQLRVEEQQSQSQDDKEARIKALEDMVKLGQMEQEDFEKVRDRLVGGDVGSTHLVKGLDRRLLERVRRGEDVMAAKEEEDNAEVEKVEEQQEELGEEEVEDEFESLEKKEVQAVRKEEKVKKGEMAPPPVPGAGKKRTRDDILRELKESRARAKEEKEKSQPALGARFKKIGAQKVKPGVWMEKDEKGRDVLITVDEQGNMKRKVRKRQENAAPKTSENGLLAVDKDAKPLGMDAPIPTNKVEEKVEDEDFDIFDDVGADYNPLGDEEDDDGSDSDAESDEGEVKEKKQKLESKSTDNATPTTESPASKPPPTSTSPPSDNPTKRDYFSAGLKRSPTPPPSAPANPLQDPSLLSALKKASNIASRVEGSGSNPQLSNEEAEAESAKIKRRKEMLASIDRDADDMDLRDEDEEGDGKVVNWDDKGEGVEAKDGQKRKRGGKKKKGDKNSVDDVMKVLEGRRKKEDK